MKTIITILILTLAAPCLAITAGEIQTLHSELLVLMDKFTWETYTNPYTGLESEVTAAERAAIKVLAIAKYQEHHAAVLLYAQELGLIN